MSVEKTLSDLKGDIGQFFKTQFEELPGVGPNIGRKVFILRRERGNFEKIVKKKDKKVFPNGIFTINFCR